MSTMSVVSVKVPQKVKEAMQSLKDSVQWSEEIRGFILDKIEEERRKENVRNAEKILKGVRRFPRGTAARLVREDRDSRHH
jgi:hypothetical protein